MDMQSTGKNLHSTMYLLNLRTRSESIQIQLNLHSTMYLLNRIRHTPLQSCKYYLHSTMYLLNPSWSADENDMTSIYIPLCIY